MYFNQSIELSILQLTINDYEILLTNDHKNRN